MSTCTCVLVLIIFITAKRLIIIITQFQTRILRQQTVMLMLEIVFSIPWQLCRHEEATTQLNCSFLTSIFPKGSLAQDESLF